MRKKNNASEAILPGKYLIIILKIAKHEFQDCSRIGSAP